MKNLKKSCRKVACLNFVQPRTLQMYYHGTLLSPQTHEGLTEVFYKMYFGKCYSFLRERCGRTVCVQVGRVKEREGERAWRGAGVHDAEIMT